MPNSLCLSMEPDPDGTAELFAEVTQASFSGVSSAWFGIAELREFGLRLQTTFPIASNEALELRGGFWSKTGGEIEQLHVGLKFYPIGGSGVVGILVQLATPLHSGDREEEQSKVMVELKTNYEPLRRFGEALVALADQTIQSAVLEASVG